MAEIERGDVDLDGTVGESDLDQLRESFNKKDASWSDGDFNGDGIVDFADFLALSVNYEE